MRLIENYRILDNIFGNGLMTGDYKQETIKSGWTAEQSVVMSEAKSFYN